MERATAELARAHIRGGHVAMGTPTSGWCRSYLQCNIVILPAHLAVDFHEFCKANSQVPQREQTHQSKLSIKSQFKIITLLNSIELSCCTGPFFP